MHNVVVMEWKYTPTDFFEETVSFAGEGYKIEINNGKVTAKIELDVYVQNPNMRDYLTDQIKRRFQVRLIFERKPYKLSKPGSAFCKYADGRKGETVFAEAGTAKFHAPAPGIIITDKHGNVKHNSKLEELKKKVEQHISTQQSITVADFRDIIQASRKYAVSILEYFDEIGFTRREADERVLN